MKKMVGTIGRLATAGWVVCSVGYFERLTDRRLSLNAPAIVKLCEPARKAGFTQRPLCSSRQQLMLLTDLAFRPNES